jgi:3',5'-cyclic AMP phosphodiesterase CpdA
MMALEGRRSWPSVPLLALVVALAGCGGGQARPVAAGSTLERTLVDIDRDGVLERGPGEPLADRGGSGAPGAVLATLVQLTDLQVRDEESPGRAPFLDRLGTPFGSTFRPHEALSTQVLAAAVRAANTVRPDAAFVTGDLLDSASRAELDQALAVLDGGEVDPDTGATGYEGVQEADQADPLFYRPDLDAPAHPALLAASARPFRSTGLRAPWYPALGNHDLLVQGETPPAAQLDAFATGRRMVTGLPAGVRADPSVDAAAAVRLLLSHDAIERARTRAVSPDPARRFLRPRELIAALTARRHAPSALRAAAGKPTLDYAVDLGPAARALVLDTVDRDGGSRGRLRPAQLDWLEEQLDRAGDRALLVFSHNPLDGTDGGEEALAALAATPAAVVAVIAGNGHRNRIRAHPGGFWQIATSSLADFPMQVRALRLRRGPGDRGFALETWMVDHEGAGIAGTARELAFLDAQGGRPQRFAGARRDRNARLYVTR